jgi:copper chaperone CopZ
MYYNTSRIIDLLKNIKSWRIKMEIHVDNIKCDTCKNKIVSKIETLIGVTKCTVDVESGVVFIDGAATNLQLVKSILKEMGYPETDATDDLDKMNDQAKSLVSDALKKLKDENA